jgi:hypothetical protein
MLPEGAVDVEVTPVSTGIPFSSLQKSSSAFSSRKNVRKLFFRFYLRFLMNGSMMSILRFDMASE